ncbi:endonuclease/exonuclease/phosphatase family protein [Cerasicoccus arenae]|uniref:Endonuclease/exonuclease/phosphatase domain-containing protein n=1 Tax=Cerasicoccus arenae TaxID=424488 RepID=A0A8J3DCI4_9BACT|nr:endonuclease/exonuclease/phosphatase family protein [Cerasicoccus arenae]MBK1859058.1 endonuclease/exonuclease/phosphatase family protein [Cerasicoccus arenae]GHC03395.1 hypothetical protein GCM10007047_19970 [Cerasicoccus arenae]
MRGLLVICVLLIPSWGLAKTVRVASYNLYNYLDTNRWVEGHYRTDYPKPEVEKDAVRKVILTTQPDILALQEIGGPLHLAELQKDLKSEGLNYPYAKCLSGPDEKRLIAVLSKIPFEAKSHTDLDFKYFDEREVIKRGLLELSFGEDEHAWTLFVVHLKSRWTDRKDDPKSIKRRTGEAQAARDYIKNEFPPNDAPRYLVVGDFNDAKRSAPVRRFLESGDNKLTLLTPAADSRGETWTFHYRREDLYERVDFILASPALTPAIKGERAVIYDGQPETSLASDHRLIYIDLNL